MPPPELNRSRTGACGDRASRTVAGLGWVTRCGQFSADEGGRPMRVSQSLTETPMSRS